MVWSLVFPVALVLAPGCGKDKGDSGRVDDSGGDAWRPDVVCPGDSGCETNTGQLYAGAAALPITPTCFETWDDLNGDGEWGRTDEPWNDCGCDQLCEGDEGYPGPDDGEADGEFQAVWIAGFGQGRPAQGVHDDLWARTIAVRSGDTTVAIVALDAVGWFYNNAVDIREAAVAKGVDVDHVVIASTHVHEGPDTLGQWGERVGRSGVDVDHRAYVIEQAAESVAQAVAALEPATLYASRVDTSIPFGSKGTRNTVRDSRDPVVIDEYVYTARFEAADGGTIASVVNWGNHPEVLGSDNTLITSDFVHYVRQGVEDGVVYDSYTVDGVGGVCVYTSAAVGGLMTPLSITVTDGEGVDHSETDWDKSEALGKVIAELALEGLGVDTPAVDPTVSVLAGQFFVPIDNIAFQAYFIMGVFDRPAYNYDPDQNMDEDNRPELLTEVGKIDIGPISMFTIPGELAPEVGIGGYDGSHVNTDEVEFIDPDNPNPPDVSQAPEGPYLKDMLDGDYQWIIGLANDEIGYIIPSYDYKLSETSPYLDEPDGDHYEETNSLGPESTPRVLEMADKLVSWTE